MTLLRHGRAPAAAAAAVLLICGIDFFARIYVPGASGDLRAESSSLPKLEPRRLGQDELDRIVALYAEAAQKQPGAAAEPGLSEARQAQQHGPLTELYAGRKVIRLSGVFRGAQPFAVVSVRDLDNGGTEAQHVQVGGELYGYRIVGIRPDALLLEAGERRVELYLFRMPA